MAETVVSLHPLLGDSQRQVFDTLGVVFEVEQFTFEHVVFFSFSRYMFIYIYIYVHQLPKIALANGALTVLYFGLAGYAGFPMAAVEHLSLGESVPLYTCP